MINLYFLKKKYRINKNIYEKLTNRIEREEIEDIITENLLNPEIDNNSQTAIVNIYCTYNNTIITITDINNNTLSWSSSGAVGFPGTRRQTPYAAQTATIECVKKCQKKNPELKEVFVRLKGFGKGRSAVIKGLEISGLKILEIKDITPVPHNGCRPKKKRRV
jgi:small subunit ribosomal protein S11